MPKFKVGEKVKWKKAIKNPYAWQSEGKVTATGKVVHITNGVYPYYVTCSEWEDKDEYFLANDDDIEKLVLNLENK